MKIHQTEGDGDILAFLTGQVIPLEFSLINRHVKATPKLTQGRVPLLNYSFQILLYLVIN